MLAAFEVGVKGGKWFSLMDKIFSMQNLKEAFAQVKANRGSARVDHQSMAQIGKHLEAHLQDIHTRLKEGRHYPQLIWRVWIPKPGCKEKRPLGIPTVRDWVDQTALRNVIEPIFKRDFSDRSYGFRPALGCKHALRCVYVLLQRGYTYVVDADIKSYFDTIPHASLLSLKAYLGQGVIETVSEWRPDKGTPQGAVISPLLMNIYLDPLDHMMEELGIEMVRYADDLVILCKSLEEATAALRKLEDWTTRAGLTLHPPGKDPDCRCSS